MTKHTDFKSLEHEGWSARAEIYDDYSARFCRQGVHQLLESADVGKKHTLLDICCGTGDAAAAAVERGAEVTGLDFSEQMIAVARSKVTGATFHVGDAEVLPFKDAVFDRVINNFGILHISEPERATAEVARVLRPGGRYAFTVWQGPEVVPLFRIIPDVISACGTLDVGLPEGPPAYSFADPAEGGRALHAAGLTDVSFADIPARVEFALDGFADFLRHSFVRTAMVLDRQTTEARARIESELRRQFSAFAHNGVVRMNVPALAISAFKPE